MESLMTGGLPPRARALTERWFELVRYAPSNRNEARSGTYRRGRFRGADDSMTQRCCAQRRLAIHDRKGENRGTGRHATQWESFRDRSPSSKRTRRRRSEDELRTTPLRRRQGRDLKDLFP